jgi:tellurite resistance protein TerC
LHTAKHAIIRSASWILCACLFALGIAYWQNYTAALTFLTGYLLEWSLSVDNLFAFLSIFTFFSVPKNLQTRVLFWGLFGAVAMRGLFILFGIALLQRFHWVFPLFGLFLLFTGFQLLRKKPDGEMTQESYVVEKLRRWLPITKEFHGAHFWVREEGKWKGTPLLLVLISIEMADLLFAMDSIPAILGITTDPFLVYTSTMFAIVGLRALYAVLSHMLTRFRYLHFGVVGILLFIGLKLCLMPLFLIPTWASLVVIIGFFLISLAASSF